MTNSKPEPIIGESGVKNKPYMVIEAGHILLSNGDQMYIPRGYVFDNASIPKIFKWKHDLFGVKFFHYKSKAFLVHDFLYNYRGYRTRGSTFAIMPVSRLWADMEMVWQMKKHGYSQFKCDVFFIAVRLFGWLNFGKI